MKRTTDEQVRLRRIQIMKDLAMGTIELKKVIPGMGQPMLKMLAEMQAMEPYKIIGRGMTDMMLAMPQEVQQLGERQLAIVWMGAMLNFLNSAIDNYLEITAKDMQDAEAAFKASQQGTNATFNTDFFPISVLDFSDSGPNPRDKQPN